MPTINLSIALVTGGMREKDGKMKRASVIILPVQIDTPLGRAYGHTTMFLCGPSKCEHDYSRYEPMEGGGTAVCAKCGARAFDEAAWL